MLPPVTVPRHPINATFSANPLIVHDPAHLTRLSRGHRSRHVVRIPAVETGEIDHYDAGDLRDRTVGHSADCPQQPHSKIRDSANSGAHASRIRTAIRHPADLWLHIYPPRNLRRAS